LSIELQLGAPWGPTRLKSYDRDLPFVFVNVAVTADGKIAPATRQFQPFSSQRDRLLMYELRSYADAVMSGARTLDLNPVKVGNGGEIYTRMRLRRALAEHPVRVVVSGRATIDPNAAIFQHRFSPIVMLVSQAAPEKRLKKLRPLVDDLATFGTHEIDFSKALRWLKTKWNVRSLLCEGGGEVNGALFKSRLVNELYLTLCPVIFGGRNAPTPADGEGVESLTEATPLKLRRMKRVGDEFFFIYRVI
jgi:2,5-diamino-6-(ribosylamino)-4(3H)-pyrimidinone 5'-phosphate reductase